MRHERQDAVDAHGRATAGYQPGWHPILSAVEVEPGHWVMVSPGGTRYAVIRSLVLGGESGYRVVSWAEQSRERRLIGYYRSLRAAAMAAHRRFIDEHAKPGGVNGR